MSDGRLKTFLQPRPWHNGYGFWLYSNTYDGESRNVGTDVIMKRVENGDILPEPTFTLSNADAQELMDALWTVGIRPTEGAGTAGAMAAAKAHIEDLRMVVGRLLPKP